jgi:hypothetical protein
VNLKLPAVVHAEDIRFLFHNSLQQSSLYDSPPLRVSSGSPNLVFQQTIHRTGSLELLEAPLQNEFRDIFEEIEWRKYDMWFRIAEKLVMWEYEVTYIERCSNWGALAVPPDMSCHAKHASSPQAALVNDEPAGVTDNVYEAVAPFVMVWLAGEAPKENVAALTVMVATLEVHGRWLASPL